MIHLAVTVVLAAASTEPIRLAAPGLTFFSMSKDQGEFYSAHLSQQLTLAGVRVTTGKEIEAVIGLERQKQLVGCVDSGSSCMAELAGALGVDGLLTGSIGRFGRNFQINLKVVSAKDGSSLAALSSRVAGDEPVLDELNRAAQRLAADLYRLMGRERPAAKAGTPAAAEVTSASASSDGLRSKAWIPAAAGGALLLGGGILVGLSADTAARIRAGDPSIQTSAQYRDATQRGSTFQTAGYVLVGVGGAAVAAAAGMFALGGGSAVSSASIVPIPGGGAAVLSGAFP